MNLENLISDMAPYTHFQKSENEVIRENPYYLGYIFIALAF